MLDPIKSRRRYFFTLVAYEFSFFSFLSCCLSCVCFWHLFWQFSLGEKGLSAWEISISTKSCQTWASLECSKAIPPPPPSFVKLEFQFDEFLLMFYALLAAPGLAKASADPNCVFAQGKLHVILLLTGRKWENCFLHSIFSQSKKAKAERTFG